MLWRSHHSFDWLKASYTVVTTTSPKYFCRCLTKQFTWESPIFSPDDLRTSSIATGGLWCPYPHTKLQAPQIEIWNTINQYSFYQIFRMSSPLNKRKSPLLKTFWRWFSFERADFSHRVQRNGLSSMKQLFSTVLLSNICTILPSTYIVFFFHCFGEKLFFHWSSGFSTNCDETSANCGGTDGGYLSPSNPYSMRRSFRGNLFSFVRSTPCW